MAKRKTSKPIERILPWPVSDVDLAFGKTGPETLPSLEECYQMERDGKISRRNRDLVSDMFFKGLAEFSAEPCDDVVPEQAMDCIKAELRSWERKHQHKELLIAWLFDQWFTDIQWKAAEVKLPE